MECEAPPVEEGEGWSFVVLPDTQHYAADHPEIFEAQAQWIAGQADAWRIRFVLHEGDVTDDNSATQWGMAREAMAELDGRVPYVLVPGNHDYGTGGSADSRETLLTESFADADIAARPSYGGSFEEGRLENTYHVFGGEEGGWLVLGLEFGPRDEVVDWADEVLARHAPMPAILLTHAYLYSDGTRYDHTTRPDQLWSPHSYPFAATGTVNDGEALWQKLVRRHSHLRLVFSGHVLNEGVARLTSERGDGSFVHQVLANYQHRPLGGGGFLRVMRVDPGLDRLCVSTYSPHLDEHKRDAANLFTLPL